MLKPSSPTEGARPARAGRRGHLGTTPQAYARGRLRTALHSLVFTGLIICICWQSERDSARPWTSQSADHKWPFQRDRKNGCFTKIGVLPDLIPIPVFLSPSKSHWQPVAGSQGLSDRLRSSCASHSQCRSLLLPDWLPVSQANSLRPSAAAGCEQPESIIPIVSVSRPNLPWIADSVIWPWPGQPGPLCPPAPAIAAAMLPRAPAASPGPLARARLRAAAIRLKFRASVVSNDRPAQDLSDVIIDHKQIRVKRVPVPTIWT